MPLTRPIYFTGFGMKGQADKQPGAQLFAPQALAPGTRDASETTTVRHTGGAAWRVWQVAGDATRSNLVRNFDPYSDMAGGSDGFGGTGGAYVCYVYFNSFAAATIIPICGLLGSTTNTFYGWFINTSGKFQLGYFPLTSSTTPTFASSDTGVTAATGTWYRLELKMDGGSGPPTLNGKVAVGDAAGTTSVSVTNGSASSGGAVTAVYLGHPSSASFTVRAWDMVFTDIAWSYAGDYPLGPVEVRGYKPNAVGTHNLDTSPSAYFWQNVSAGSRSAISSSDTTSYGLIDDDPISLYSSDNDYIGMGNSVFGGTESATGAGTAASISGTWTTVTNAQGAPTRAVGAAASATNSAVATPSKNGSAVMALSNWTGIGAAHSITSLTIAVRAALTVNGTLNSIKMDLYDNTTLLQAGTAQNPTVNTFQDYSQSFSGFGTVLGSHLFIRVTVAKGSTNTTYTVDIDGATLSGVSYSSANPTTPNVAKYVDYLFQDEAAITDDPAAISFFVAYESDDSRLAGNIFNTNQFEWRISDGTNEENLVYVENSGIAVNAGYHVFTGKVATADINNSNPSGSFVNSTGSGSTLQRVAQSFVATQTAVDGVELDMAYGGTRTSVNATRVYICADDGTGKPNMNNIITSNSPSGTSPFSVKLGTTASAIRFNLQRATLTIGTTYWIVLENAFAADTTNFWRWATSSTSYASGAGATYNGTTGTWTTGLTDMSFKVLRRPVLTQTDFDAYSLRMGYATNVDSNPFMRYAYVEALYVAPTTPVSAGTAYTDSATVSSVTAISASEVYSVVESNTISSKTTPSSSDFAADVDANTITSVTSLSAVDSHTTADSATVSGSTTPSSSENLAAVDAATIFSKTTPSATDVAADVESATIASVTSLSFTEVTPPDSGTVSGTTTPSSAETAQYVDSATVSSSSSVTSADVAAFTDANTVSGSSTPSSNDIAAYVDGANTIAGVTSLNAVEGHEIPDAATITSITDISASSEIYTPGSTAYTDSATTSTTTSVASSDVAAYIDVATVSSATTPSATDVVADVDANTVKSVTTPSANDTASTIDAGTISGITSLSFVEVTPPDSATVSGATSVATSEIAAYVESATVAGSTSVSSSEVSGFVDQATVEGKTNPTAVDVSATVDAATISSLSSASTTDVVSDSESATCSGTTYVEPVVETAQYVDSSTVSGSTSVNSSENIFHGNNDADTVVGISTPTSADIAQYVDLAQIASVTTPSSLEIHDIPDSSTISGVSTVISSDIYGAVDTATVSAKTAVSSVDTAQYRDLATISGATTPSAVEGNQQNVIDADTVSSKTNVTPVEVFAGNDATTVNTVTTISSSDAITYAESGTVSGSTSVFDTDTAQYVDSATVASVTTFSYSEIYTPPTGYVDAATITSITTISATEGNFIVGAFALVGTIQARWAATAFFGRLIASSINRWTSTATIKRLTANTRRRWYTRWSG